MRLGSRDRREKVVTTFERLKDMDRTAEALGMTRDNVRKHLKGAGVAYKEDPEEPEIVTPTSWCDLTREGTWQRVVYTDTRNTVTRRRRDGSSYRSEEFLFDPGIVYPVGWKGPLLAKIRAPRRVYDNVRRAIVFGVQDRSPACGPAMNSMMGLAQTLGITDIYAARCTYARKWYEALFGGAPRKDVGHTLEVAQYSSAFEDLLTSKRVSLSDRLDFCAEVNIIPTARNPLSGLTTYGKGKSAIFAHPRQDLLPVPRHPSEFPINVQGSGYMTTPNYVDRKEGHVARFHHIVGFTIIELDEEGRHWAEPVEINMRTGEFRWQDIRGDGYGRITNGHRPKFMNAGDIHTELQDPQAMRATFFGEDSMSAVLRPETTVLGDIVDFSEFGHHNRKNPWHRYAVKLKGSTVLSIMSHVADTLTKIRDTLPPGSLYVDKGNHDEHPDRWLQETEASQDPTNSIIHLKANLEARRQLADDPGCVPKVFEWMVRELASDGLKGVTFLARDDSLKVDGVELAQHGDKGANGARGSLAGMVRMASKMSGEHTHSPGKREGACSAGYLGKINPMPPYARGGATTWAHANTIGQPGGKMSIIFIHDGKWRAGPRVFRPLTKKSKAA